MVNVINLKKINRLRKLETLLNKRIQCDIKSEDYLTTTIKIEDRAKAAQDLCPELSVQKNENFNIETLNNKKRKALDSNDERPPKISKLSKSVFYRSYLTGKAVNPFSEKIEVKPEVIKKFQILTYDTVHSSEMNEHHRQRAKVIMSVSVDGVSYKITSPEIVKDIHRRMDIIIKKYLRSDELNTIRLDSNTPMISKQHRYDKTIYKSNNDILVTKKRKEPIIEDEIIIISSDDEDESMLNKSQSLRAVHGSSVVILTYPKFKDTHRQ